MNRTCYRQGVDHNLYINMCIRDAAYIDISPYRDTFGSNTTFRLYQYIEYHDMSMYRDQNCILIHTD